MFHHETLSMYETTVTRVTPPERLPKKDHATYRDPTATTKFPV